ncbi:hypothetical protein UCDDA912_g04484 [Diaporthe ampelina]|uniref:Uncharacterized protein n=1 Tax=Diaporthe ampelina TaxID=1214573 RepID=A0A0G2HKG4_9PEZI|nr:hypothetical protein UCDDA912_g04484 [Diaporthe ampelina]
MATASAIAIAAAYHTTTDPRLYAYPYVHPAVHGLGLPTGSAYTQSSAPDQYEALLGRRLAPTPARLASRVLYVPSHNDKAAHLPVYDFTGDYREAVGDEPVGSSRFKTRLGLMPKPNGDGRGPSEVSYLVDFEPLERRRSLPSCPVASPGGTSPGTGTSRKGSLGAGAALVTRGTVSRRTLYGGAEVGLTIPPPQAPLADGDVAYTLTPSSTGAGFIPVAASFPLPPTAGRLGSSRNPWFTFTVPGLPDGDRTLQWQVHPAEHGLLRYTLVELGGRPSSSSGGCGAAAAGAPRDVGNWWEETGEGEGEGGRDGAGDGHEVPYSAAAERHEHRIRAIYHNVGLGFSLSQPFSEGALLLQDGLDPELEAIVVASLLGLLWRARGEESRPRKNSKGDGPPRKGSKSSEAGTPPARRQGISAANAGEDAPLPARPARRKSLIGKILGKK